MESKKDKFRRTLMNLTDSGRFIPGIYNYCDRWCERCTLQHKCLTYAHEQEMKEESTNPETDLIDNENFWEQIQLSFEVTLDMISEDAKRLGISLDVQPCFEEQEYIETDAEKSARDYGHSIWSWLNANKEIINLKAGLLLQPSCNSASALQFSDAIEIVQWYCHFISAKVHRAHYDLDSRLQTENDESDVTSDNNGSAKIALIAINRSMEALTLLYPVMKEQEDDILCFLGQLSKIKKQMLVTFPAAMDFKRPGFDD